MTPIKRRYALTVLAALVALFLGRLAFCDFTWWDDPKTVFENTWLNPVTFDSLRQFWLHAAMAIYIPLTYTVWAAVALIARVPAGEFGITLNPLLFHATNLAVHILASFAAWCFLRRMLGNDLAALFGAAFWALHPVQVESVGWVSGLKDVLSGCLVLVCLCQYIRWRQDGGTRAYALAFTAFILAMLAKPSAITVPLLLSAIDRLKFDKSFVNVSLAPFALAVIPIAWIARAVQPAIIMQHSPWLGPLIAGDSLSFYMVKTVFPYQLTFDYGHNPSAILRSGEIWYAWLAPVICMAALLVAWRRRPIGSTVRSDMLLGFIIFCAAPLPVLGLTRFDYQFVSTVADHYLYVALLGPSLMLGTLLRRSGKAVYICAALLIAMLGLRACFQTPVWQNERTLMEYCLTINPRSWTANVNLASYEGRFGHIDAEEKHLLRAEQLQDIQPLTEQGLIEVYIQKGDYAEADTHARKLIGIYEKVYGNKGPDTIPGYLSVINVYYAHKLPTEAERYAKEALSRDPANPDVKQWIERLRWVEADPDFIKRQTSSLPAAATRP